MNLIHIFWSQGHPLRIYVLDYFLVLKFYQDLLSYLYSKSSNYWPQKLSDALLMLGVVGKALWACLRKAALMTKVAFSTLLCLCQAPCSEAFPDLVLFSGITGKEKHSWSLLLDPQIHLEFLVCLGHDCPQILAYVALICMVHFFYKWLYFSFGCGSHFFASSHSSVFFFLMLDNINIIWLRIWIMLSLFKSYYFWFNRHSRNLMISLVLLKFAFKF